MAEGKRKRILFIQIKRETHRWEKGGGRAAHNQQAFWTHSMEIGEQILSQENHRGTINFFKAPHAHWEQSILLKMNTDQISCR